MMPRRLSAVLWGLLVLWSVAVWAESDGPVLHEYVPPDAAEDVDLSSTDVTGQLPAAVRTPSGTVVPPSVDRTPEPTRVYQKQPEGAAPGFRPDRDTRRPNVERYDDPFTPALTPFKRMFAYDAVLPDYTLAVRDPDLTQVPVGGEAEDDDDRFFGDMMVQLRGGEPVRIPSVGPGARLIKLLTSPKTELTVWRDGADNWFVKSDRSTRVRLITELAIERDSFGSDFPDVSWGALPTVGPQPPEHRASFLRVARHIGISRDRMRPQEVVTRMVAYFRSFAPSEEPPSEQGDIYLDLALTKKGVCRHRAFAFLITALYMGIPSRLVHNEAHAWVEVFDGKLWRRIDLGGAALNLEDDPHLDRPPHNPPPDQFPWPTGRDSGADLAHRNREAALEQQADSQSAEGTDPSAPGVVDPNAPPGDPTAPAPANNLPRSTLSIDSIDRDIFRGLPVRITGTARSEGQPCAHLRVDVLLAVEGEAAERRLGSLSTDERGVYDGAVVVPPDIPIGDHELVVATAGDARCGAGEAR